MTPIEELQEEISDLKGEVSDTASDRDTAKEELDEALGQIEGYADRLREIENDADKLARAILDLRDDMEKLK